MEQVSLQALPFKEAIDYFRKKGYKIGFDYRDVEPETHAQAFTVAKAMRTDLLQDIRAGVDDAVANGVAFGDFQKSLQPTLEAKGWWGVKTMTDPATGEDKEVQLGSARRLRTIYDTNMRTAFAAGKWEQIVSTKKAFPYLRYVGMDDDRERPEHREWNDTVLPVDHEFWRTHYPPNAWGCRCRVVQCNNDTLSGLGLDVSDKAPPSALVNYINKRTGTVTAVPKGVDPSFGYNPGIERMKSLTPPPLDKPLDVPFTGDPATVPMPAPREVAKEKLLPAGTTDEESIEAFLGAFGAAPGKPKIFTDVAGEPVVISDDLFKYGDGRTLKLGKDNRARMMLLLAATIQDPDEIWQVWEEYPKGRWTLRRKYLARYDIDGEKDRGFVIFDTNPSGWTGVTAFAPGRDKYLEKKGRNGALVYRRPDDAE